MFNGKKKGNGPEMSRNMEISAGKEPESMGGEPFTLVAKQSLIAGVSTVPPALIIGSVLGAFRSSHPTAFALAFTMQWFAFGSTFWATRSFLISPPIYTLHPLSLESHPKAASTVAGCLSGALVGLLARGRRSVVPGALTFSILGYLGQTAFSAFEAKQLLLQSHESLRINASGTSDGGGPTRDGNGTKENVLQRLAKSKWSPMTELSDVDHRRILMHRKEEIEDEIKAIDQEIEKLCNENR